MKTTIYCVTYTDNNEKFLHFCSHNPLMAYKEKKDLQQRFYELDLTLKVEIEEKTIEL